MKTLFITVDTFKTCFKSLLLVFLAAFTCQPISAYDFEVNGLSYNVVSEEDHTCEVASGRSLTGKVTIPEWVNPFDGKETYTVIGIGECAFYETYKIDSIIIPKTVTYIEEQAFSYCRGLTSIKIPEGVTVINSSTFYDCFNLENVELPNTVDSIGLYAFYFCKKMKSITLPNSLKYIGGSAFNLSGLKEISIPKSVRTIANWAFYDCDSLRNVVIEEGTDTLSLGYTDFVSYGGGNGLFQHCDSLEKVYIGRPLEYETGQSYGFSPFAKCYALKEVVFGPNVTNITKNCFWGCEKLKNVTMTNSITDIGAGAFQNCTSLESIVIPNSVTIINDYLFDGCTNLRNVTLPDNITYIGREAFQHCDSLASFVIPNTIETIYFGTFQNCKSLSEIRIPNSVKEISGCAFRYCSKLKNVVIEDGDESLFIGSGAQYYYTNVETPGQFSECPLDSFYLGRNVTYNYSPIKLNTTLRAVKIGDKVTSIGRYFFYKCTGLTNISIPSTVTEIAEGVFDSCSELLQVTIGSSTTDETILKQSRVTRTAAEENVVATIGSSAFNGCTKLKDLHCLFTTPPSIAANAFSNEQYSNVTLYVPQTSIETYRSADVWKNFLNINEDMTSIKNIRKDSDSTTIVYDLKGHRLSNPMRGLNIINGRKVLVK